MRTQFFKYEGAGNDFIIIDNRAALFHPAAAFVAALCDRRFGIGADGLMTLEYEDGVDFRMRYFNSDGPEATMCGNGGRCIALFARDLGIGGKRKTFMAVDGLHEAYILSGDGCAGEVSLRMGPISEITRMAGGYFVDTGSPHYVEFTDNLDSLDVFSIGRRMRDSERFKSMGGANFNFVQQTAADRLRIRTYERGVEEETLACGTGSVAAALVAAQLNANSEKFYVDTRGGELSVDFSDKNEKVWLTGPARRVFGGNFDIDNFAAE